jgi:Domain of unknown function (DUF222)/HNH endonuclease
MGLLVLVTTGFDCDDLQLGREITLLSAQINVASYRLLKLIAEFDLRGGWRSGGAMRSCAHWLAAHCGMEIGAAREKVRVARRLSGLPEMEQAFSTGELSYSKVRAITRVATESNEGFLVMMAEQSSASHLEKLVARYKPVNELGPLADLAADGAPGDGSIGDPAVEASSGEAGVAGAQGPDPALNAAQDEDNRREHARELYWFQDKDGMWIIHAKLPPEQGQLVVKTLEAVARPLQEERQDDWKEKQKARMQQVARHIMRRHREVGNSEDGSPAKETPASVEYERAEEKISAETFSQFMNHVRADAFANLAEHFLATSGDYPQLQGLKGAERCQVVLHVDVNTLREQRSGVCCTHGKAHFEDKPWLSPTTARRLSCDASLVTVLEDDAGKVLNVGRRSRIVPAHIRRALMERDGVCQYPGCHESRYVDAHHVKHWADGGETSLENLVTLCKFHHRQLHRGSFEILTGGAGPVEIAEISAEIFGGPR